MMFWIIWTAVVSLSIGFVMGATFRQYRKPKVINVIPDDYDLVRSDRVWYSVDLSDSSGATAGKARLR